MHYEVIYHAANDEKNTEIFHVDASNATKAKAIFKAQRHLKGMTIVEARRSFDHFYEARVFVNVGPVPKGRDMDIEAVREHLEERITIETNSEDGGFVAGFEDLEDEEDDDKSPPEVGAISIDWGTLRPLAVNEMDSPYEASPPRADLLNDIKAIANRAGWNDDTLIQQLALFIANETTDSQALINFLEDQESEEQSNLIE